MLASRDAEQSPGVHFAAAVTATPVNLELLAARGFDLAGEGLGPDDLVVAIVADGDDAADAAAGAVEARLAGRAEASVATADVPPRSVRSAARRHPGANVAFVSVPGRHATYEAAEALAAGLHVFCFSDGVDLDVEAALKRRAADRGLLFMGADCGTAIIDGISFGFANAIEPGPVGIVGASGTGIQELTCLLDRAGVGVSHAVGVGGRDLSATVGGEMTIHALRLLARDSGTEAVVVVSKPPGPGVAGRVAQAAAETGMPVVLCFLGERPGPPSGGAIEVTASLEDAAVRIARTVGARLTVEDPDVPGAPTRGDIRGSFAGGSLCYEAMAVISAAVGEVGSNVPLRPEWSASPFGDVSGHACFDFGEDELTEGRTHPMIDPTLRNAALARAVTDPAVGVVVADVVLGYGAHPDPAQGLARTLEEASRDAARPPTVVVSVCGTRADPQGLDGQRERLRAAGAVVTGSAAGAARMALRAAGMRP